MGLRQLAAYRGKLEAGVMVPFQLAGAPTSGAGGSFASRAVVGSLLIDNANGKAYICTAVGGGSVTWTVVGAQV
jgi:hypothetical protein